MTPTERERINEAINGWFKISGENYWSDYFTDESANARLLEAMPFATLERSKADGESWWGCSWENHEAAIQMWDANRKTAIVLAFLKYMEANPK